MIKFNLQNRHSEKITILIKHNYNKSYVTMMCVSQNVLLYCIYSSCDDVRGGEVNDILEIVCYLKLMNFLFQEFST
jgi:hypothetical protein